MFWAPFSAFPPFVFQIISTIPELKSVRKEMESVLLATWTEYNCSNLIDLFTVFEAILLGG